MKSILLIESECEVIPNPLEKIIRDCGNTFKRSEAEDVFTSGILNQEPFAAAVLDCQQLDSAELTCVMKLSSLMPNLPIIISAQRIALETYRKIDQLRNTVAIQKGFDPSVFEDLLMKACTEGKAKPDVSPRFVTNEAVRVMLLDSGLMVSSRMRNFSSTGLFLEYRGLALQVGDKVRVSVSAPGFDSKKHLHLQARVVWEHKVRDERGAARGVGMQFQAA